MFAPNKHLAARKLFPNYIALHKERQKMYGKPKSCVHCGVKGDGKRFEWANKSHRYIDVEDFIGLCVRCHKKHDHQGYKDKYERIGLSTARG